MKKNVMLLIVFMLLGMTSSEILAQNSSYENTLKTEKHRVGKRFILDTKSGETYQASQSITLTEGFGIAKGETFHASLIDEQALLKTEAAHLVIVADASRGILEVQTSNVVADDDTVFRLYDFGGNLLAAKKAISCKALFDMTNYSSGIYIVRQYNDNEAVVAKKIIY